MQKKHGGWRSSDAVVDTKDNRSVTGGFLD
jgi:hypothetical protein